MLSVLETKRRIKSLQLPNANIAEILKLNLYQLMPNATVVQSERVPKIKLRDLEQKLIKSPLCKLSPYSK
jgi:hypothetical protein